MLDYFIKFTRAYSINKIEKNVVPNISKWINK